MTPRRPSSTTSLAHSLLLGPACTLERISMFLLSVRETLTWLGLGLGLGLGQGKALGLGSGQG